MELKKVTSKESLRIIQKREPKGTFYRQCGEMWIGIDNREGEAWVEEFETQDDCKAWLKDEAEPSENINARFKIK
ncbi:hypothetical protein [Cytobacillus oceanisediminis]|uniref:hypothetical protein n=1 Tax=Cytobacillus oceanisediminis TaxID=665099 RepID=UPI001FB45AEA|nr:hypothetical protein [Cytobacillus oceanisediminis]UOE58222.1 hypothetical protein IRB79_27375 [Cytobacillus oceanisediminis]